VTVLHFSGGFKLVYKPHSLGVDVHFGELLGWLNERGEHPPFRTLKVIDRGDYGWVEFVPARGCSTEEEIHRFYRRQGGLLALLYSLEATDFHLENLIASGEDPVLVDLESLFHPRVTKVSQDIPSLRLASAAMDYSVLRIGMLPQRIWTVDNEDGIDLSGLGGASGQLTPFPVLTYENQSTDEMRAVRKRLEMSGSQNRPTLDGGAVNLQDYTADIISGFTSVYKLLLKNRDELLTRGGPLDNFAEDEVRAVLRATRVYGELLTESYHPDVLRDALDRTRLFDRLWSVVEFFPSMAKAVPSEVEDLHQGDIPFFSCRPNARDLWNSRGEKLPDFFEETTLEAVRRRIKGLSEDDLSRQVWFVSASISSTTLGIDRASFAASKLAPPQGDFDKARLLRASRAVADRLEAIAIRDEEAVNWVGMTFLGGRSWTLMPLTPEMYNGTLGVALFLGYLGQVAGEERYTALSKLIMRGLTKLIEGLPAGDARQPGTAGELGGFNGIGSIIYTLSHLGTLWGAEEFFAQAEALIEYLPGVIEEDKSLDIISGSAGCIGNLLSLHRCASSARALEVATACAEHLMSRARAMGEGLAWETPMMGEGPLAGFSHGASGMGWALLEMAAVSGDGKYMKAALEAFAYERSVFSHEEGNWPDLREISKPTEGGPTFMTTWCHGAPGIGLARARALAHLDNALLREDLERAVAATRKRGFGMNHSLCHGDLGNLEFLLEASSVLDDAALRAEVERIATSVLDSIDRYGWLCGTPKGIETPGLMTGLAGIGYGLLRLAEPDRTPSILRLSPPPPGGRGAR
jgi:type 2 lantibiotic biosynthesis protein LanM